MGHWLEPARTSIAQHAADLKVRRTWLFSSGPIGEPPLPTAEDAVPVDESMAATTATVTDRSPARSIGSAWASQSVRCCGLSAHTRGTTGIGAPSPTGLAGSRVISRSEAIVVARIAGGIGIARLIDEAFGCAADERNESPFHPRMHGVAMLSTEASGAGTTFRAGVDRTRHENRDGGAGTRRWVCPASPGTSLWREWRRGARRVSRSGIREDASDTGQEVLHARRTCTRHPAQCRSPAAGSSLGYRGRPDRRRRGRGVRRLQPPQRRGRPGREAGLAGRAASSLTTRLPDCFCCSGSGAAACGCRGHDSRAALRARRPRLQARVLTSTPATTQGRCPC